MEQILWLYALPYDPRYPVLCFDERPCFLIGDVVEPLSLQTGRVRKEHYAYEKLGSCALFAAVQPLTGRRMAQVYPQRTMLEYTTFMQMVAEAFPDAIKIRIVEDNLNTHRISAFYQHLPAHQAFALAQRFEFYYTPKSASWLNMIEIEFSALARQCLHRRLPTQERLAHEVLTLVQQRNDQQILLNWQFSIASARTKLNSHYTQVLPDNQQYMTT
jgi:DDE superfamily endonuclease